MKRRAYRRTPINQFEVAKATEKATDSRLILAIDVPKEDMVAALTTQTAEVLCTLTWKHLGQSTVLVDKLGQLRDAGYTVERVLQSAAETVGLVPLPEERSALMTIAAEAHRCLRACKQAKQRILELAAGGASEVMAPAVGLPTGDLHLNFSSTT